MLFYSNGTDLHSHSNKTLIYPYFSPHFFFSQHHTAINNEHFTVRRYMDAMAIVRTFGKPTLFITVTCNPRWPDITNALLPGQRPEDRPDLVARVFRLKLRRIMDDLTNDGVFGKVSAYMSVIEFQKRGTL